jgi:RNA-binding protein
MDLSGAQKKYLRGLAHHLDPVVHVGAGGMTPGVVQALDQALLDHELIKVRVHQPADKRGLARELAAACNAALCGLIGHTAILYRPHPRKPRITLPD